MFDIHFDYPVTRVFVNRWFAPFVIFGSLIILAILTTLNVALTGYETVNNFKSDFNFTHLHWFHRWVPANAPKAGTMCEPHLFNVRDVFVTNYTLFQWNVDSINNATAGETGVTYSGETLNGCDVAAVFISGDMRTWTLDISVGVVCTMPGVFDVNMMTTFSLSSLPGSSSSFFGASQSTSNRPNSVEARIGAVDQLLFHASTDLGIRLQTFVQTLGVNYPLVLSLRADFPHCPASLGPNADCATRAPTFQIPTAAAIFPNTTLRPFDSSDPSSRPVIDNSSSAALSNLIQTLHAAVRLDLGNPSPNNIFLNDSVVDLTLQQTFPSFSGVPAMDSSLWTYRKSPIYSSFALTRAGIANIRLTYLCRLQQLKSPGPLFIAVLVATLSMFSTGWALFMFGATTVVKRSNTIAANSCDGHIAEGKHAGY